MAKIADEHLKLDPWKIIEEGFDPKHAQVDESIFSQANEYMGVRGYFEEGTTGDTLLGSYFNGIYEYSRTERDTNYRGVVKKPHFMINSVDWLYVRIEIENEQLDLNSVFFEDFTRVLDLKKGTMTRSFTWRTQFGKELRLTFERFLHMEKSTNGYQKIIIEPLNFSGEINVLMGIDFDTRDGHDPQSFWKEQRKGTREENLGILCETVSTEQEVFAGCRIQVNQEHQKKLIEKERFIGFQMTLSLVEKKATEIERIASNISRKNGDNPDRLWQDGVETLHEAIQLTYDQAKKEQEQYWKRVWDHFDVQIEGDERNQQGIRYCIFQLQQTYHGQDHTHNIGAKGLTGEVYNGYTFWDTETFCLPYYLFNNVKAAKNLLEFRYETLDKARIRATQLDCRGACYPVSTINGEEACVFWEYANGQFQASTGVAYGIWHYVNLTGDKEFLYEKGVEMLVEISRFLASRGDWGQESHKFGFYGVMGPDEFQMMVNHDAYTNYMAQQTFAYALTVLSELSEKEPAIFAQLKERTGVTETEREYWWKCAGNTWLHKSPEGIIEQNKGFFDLPHIEADLIPPTQFPLYEHWAHDRLYRNDMIKQPDVLMFQFLHNQWFTEESKRVNYDYYEPRTIHESSLSPSVHSILAAELGKFEQALSFFSFSTRMDLDDYNRNTKDGLHTTSLAAAWMNIVYGFGGLRSDGMELILNPVLPKQWDSYTFRIEYRKTILEVKVAKEEVRFKVLKGDKIHFIIYGSPLTVDSEEVNVMIPEDKRIN